MRRDRSGPVGCETSRPRLIQLVSGRGTVEAFAAQRGDRSPSHSVARRREALSAAVAPPAIPHSVPCPGPPVASPAAATAALSSRRHGASRPVQQRSRARPAARARSSQLRARTARPAALPAPHRPDALRAALGRAPSSLLLVAGAPAGGFGGAEWRGAPSVSAARHGTPVLLSQQSGAAAALPALPAPLRAAEPSPPAAPGHGRSAESRPPPRRRPLNGAPRDAIPPSPPASPAAPRRSCRRSAG